jgi:gamma-glutamylcyclotransferase (GGCT)/AIG2-like uncharacterized protein YtfP
LEINGVKQGVKTAIILPPDEKKRLKKVAEMFARGLYYWHTKKSAKPYCSVVVYLFQERYEHLIKILENINLIRLFPNSFEYSFNITRETGEAVIFIYIYQKPAFLVELVTEERYSRMKDKTSKKGSDRKSIIEILG